jgi:hypothetical protein
LIEIGIGEDHVGALAATFEPHLLEVRVRGVAQELPAGFCRACESQHVDVGMTAKWCPCGGAEAGDDVEHTGRKPGFDGQFRQPQ